MKNITLSVDDTVLKAARRYAYERDLSVNGLVREYLGSIANKKNRADSARKKIKAMSDKSTARIGATSWKSEELHER